MQEARKYDSAEEFVDSKKERFYRGTVKGETKKMPVVFDEAKGLTFVARKESTAKAYGDTVEQYLANKDAKILYEPSTGFKFKKVLCLLMQ